MSEMMKMKRTKKDVVNLSKVDEKLSQQFPALNLLKRK
jgi:hypothetical protein